MYAAVSPMIRKLWLFRSDFWKIFLYIKQICIVSRFFKNPFFPVLLKHNWHRSLYKFMVYSMMIWFTYVVKWLPRLVQLTSFSHTIKEKKWEKELLLVVRILRIHHLKKFLMYHIAVWAIVIMLYVTSLVLVYLITESLYLFTTFL